MTNLNASYVCRVLYGMAEIPKDHDELIELIIEIQSEPELYLNTGQACRSLELLRQMAGISGE